MKISIHHKPGSFSDQWIQYCQLKEIPYKVVNCYATDIIKQVSDCQGLLWHWEQNDYKAELFARQLILSLEKKGIKVFPDINTCWHNNDTIGKNYLLEAVKAPLINTYMFLSKQDAFQWSKSISFPKVLKLRNGTGKSGIKFMRKSSDARKSINKAFGNGFSAPKANYQSNGIYRNKEKGYVLFQDYLPENEIQTRLAVIGKRCFGLSYSSEKAIFPGSSETILYDPASIDKKMIALSFLLSKKLKFQSFTLDFILKNGEPQIIELNNENLSETALENCPGYWDSNLNWHPKKVNPAIFIIEDFLAHFIHRSC